MLAHPGVLTMMTLPMTSMTTPPAASVSASASRARGTSCAVSAVAVAPDGVTDERVRRVVGFCALRDRNLWVSTETQPRISLERMLRGAALVSLLEGTDEDALAIANAIDAQASARPGRCWYRKSPIAISRSSTASPART